jgi:hypothetical protein
MKALRNSGYRYGAHVSLSLIIKDNNRENIIWKSAEREFYDYQSCVDASEASLSR